MRVEADFGRLSLSGYSQLVRDFRRARTGLQELEQEAGRRGKEFAAMLGEHGAHWWVLYRLPYAEHIALMYCALGWTQRLRDAAQAANPARAFLKLMTEDEGRGENPVAAMDGARRGAFLNLLISGLYSLESIGYFGLSINELLGQAAAGDRGALLRAISVDRCVLGSPVATQIMAAAQLARDKAFFSGLFKRIREPHAGRRQYVDLRFFHRLLKDVNKDVRLTAEETLTLVGDHLGLYSTKGGDAVKGLRELFRTWDGEAAS